MKKAHTLSAENLGVAQRLREARNHLNLSQADVSRQLGISRERLASYEDGRTPLRFELALRFCWQFVFSEEWLALGVKEILARWDKKDPAKYKHVWHSSKARWCMSLLYSPAFHKIKPGTLFIDAYNEHLQAVYEANYVANIASIGLGPSIVISSSPSDDQLKNYFHALLETWMDFNDEPIKKYRFLMSMARAARKIQICLSSNELTEQEQESIKLDGWESGKLADNITEDSAEMDDFIDKQAPDFLANIASNFKVSFNPDKEKPVDNIPKHGNIERVKTKLPGLMDRLKKATEQRGKKAELARFLDVPLPKVSQWLSGLHEPGGETTLQLLNWVEQQERK